MISKGRWVVGKSQTGVGIYVYSGDEPVCEVNSDLPAAQAKANARLIAASPDLFRACQQVLEASEDGCATRDVDWSMLRDAWKSAGGK